MSHYSKTIILLFLPFLSVAGYAQNNWEATLGGGYTNYLGDLVAPIFTFKESHPAYGFGLRKYVDNNYSLRLNILRGTLSGDDNNFDRNRARGNSFSVDYTEFSIVHEVDLKGHKRFTNKHGFRTMTTPYFFLGLGITLAEPDVTYGQPNKDVLVDYPEWHVAIPLGGGIKKDLSEHFFISIEYGLRLTLSDNIDGTQESGNAYHNDAYVFGGLVAGYRFIKKPKNLEEETEGLE